MTDEPFDDKEARFVELIALGGTMRSVADELSVSPALLCKWLADPSRKELREQYARAREAQGDVYADRVVDTAMDPTIDPAVARVRIDALKWAAGKRKPKVYGDKMHTEHSGSVTLSHEDAIAQLEPKRAGDAASAAG